MRSYLTHVLFESFGFAKMTSEQPTGLFSPESEEAIGAVLKWENEKIKNDS